MEKYKVTITDLYNDVFELSFVKHEYRNLMMLIAYNYPEEFGACKGRGLCGTCHIKIISGHLNQSIDSREQKTLDTLFYSDTTSRLACQILLDEKINNMTFKIITEEHTNTNTYE